MTLIGTLISIILACATGASAVFAAEMAPRAQDLLTCYQDLGPYTTTGAHAAVYPEKSSWAVLTGNYQGQAGLWIYEDQGVSFAAIDPSLAGKTITFGLNAGKNGKTVIYQPAGGGHGPRVWLSPPGANHGSGVTVLFSSADDPEKRAPMEAELLTMTQGMTKTWDAREEQLVQAVNDGRYIWVDVDVDDYKNAVGKCARLLDNSTETASLRDALRSAAAELSKRADQSGVVHDVHPSTFLANPQY